ncbi:hypothetical protein [Tsukamurella paurometabola]|uniref:Lipoprotein n=1 Tax=Tsukamurella paurometabola TaxID=2061 RepID=A0ABS5NDV1_TSUPA|nr:hypothetical protein [Tsukamurella paurometabola]MBS4102087.1 hypothetical protein [Tsukamurella paurometabola]
MPRLRAALAITGLAVVLTSCAVTGTGDNAPESAAPSTVSSPLAASQLVGRTVADAEAVLRRTTIALPDNESRFRGPDVYRLAPGGALAPIAVAEAAPRTVVAATFAGPGVSPLDDVRAGLVVADAGAAEPRPDTMEYADLEDRLLDAMGLRPPGSTSVSYLYVVGGESTDEAFWRFVDRAIGRMPLTRTTTAALAGRSIPPVAPAKEGEYATPDDKTWVDGLRLDRVAVAEAPASAAWLHTRFDIAPQSRVCAVNIEDVLRSRFAVTPARADDVHTLDRASAHRATVAGGVVDFYLTVDCITAVDIAPTPR